MADELLEADPEAEAGVRLADAVLLVVPIGVVETVKGGEGVDVSERVLLQEIEAVGVRPDVTVPVKEPLLEGVTLPLPVCEAVCEPLCVPV